ncbi:SusC/RagA family TonB-linked outer membrane protein [Bacteroidia bacterium]|nr:SusC/RagA family TonB-linked outer membrane protein [Bacteroidia bacterium]
MKNKVLITLTALLMSAGVVLAQELNVSGTVLDANSDPVVGATVMVKGSTTGTITGINGDYNIQAAHDGTLTFSFLGMSPVDVAINGRGRLDVRMATGDTELQEVVVTALGVSRQSKGLSYSVAAVDNAEITKGGERSALNALQGKIAGVSITSNSGAPGSSSRMVLRGYSSINGNNEPLFVVDGVPISNNASQTDIELYNTVDFGNAINDINPNDIESMTVLKGASASALYGSRAANGVVLITTKSGVAQDKMHIDYSGTVNFTNYLPILKLQDKFGQGWSGHFAYDENGSWGPKFDGKDRLYGRIINGQQMYKPFVGQPTNMEDFYQTGHSVNNSISLSGGTNKTTYYASYSNVTEDGIVPTSVDKYIRNTFAFNGKTTGKYMTVSSAITYNQKSMSAVAGGQGNSLFNNIMQIPRDFSIVDMANYKSQFYDINGYYTGYGVVNPYWSANEDGDKYDEDHVYGNLKIDVPIYKSLQFTARVGEDFYTSRQKQWNAIVAPEPWSENYGTSINDVGMVSEKRDYRREFNADAFLTFAPTVGDFSLNGLVGYNLNARYRNDFKVQVDGLDLPDFYHLKNSPATPVPTQRTEQRRLVGAYAQLDFDFKRMVFLNLGARNDWSSTLPEDANSYFYPMAGVSLLFSEMIPAIQKVVNFGKVRVSYGMTGNDPDPYVLKSVMAGGDILPISFGNGVKFPFNGLNAYEVSNTIGNATLRPELTKEFEVGADLRFLDSRLNIDIAYYKRNTTDQIMDVPIATSSGYSIAWMNLGDVQNQGIELAVKVTPIKTKILGEDLQWDLGVTFTKNENKVIELLDGVLDEIQIGGFSGTGIWAKAGEKMGYFKTTGVQKTEDGKIIVGPNGVPLITSATEAYGSFQHDYVMGFSTQLGWNGIYLSASFDFRKGGLFFSRTSDINDFVGNNLRTAYNDRQPFVVPNSVRATKDASGNTIYVENTTPITMANINTYWDRGGPEGEASKLIDKTSFRAREVVLGYRLPKKWVSKTPFAGIDVSINARNLFLWLPKSNTFIDPDVTTFGSGIGGEFGEFSAYPSTRSWGFSLKLSI